MHLTDDYDFLLNSCRCEPQHGLITDLWLKRRSRLNYFSKKIAPVRYLLSVHLFFPPHSLIHDPEMSLFFCRATFAERRAATLIGDERVNCPSSCSTFELSHRKNPLGPD